jgi:hypothetical protein
LRCSGSTIKNSPGASSREVHTLPDVNKQSVGIRRLHLILSVSLRESTAGSKQNRFDKLLVWPVEK